MASLEGSCRWAGCTEQHRHPVTGAPPDYHYVIGITKEPRWREPSYRRRSKDPRQWWYRVREIAAALHVNVQTVQRYIRDGHLKATQAPAGVAAAAAKGRHSRSPWLIHGQDFEEFLRNQRKSYPVVHPGDGAEGSGR